MKPTQRNLILRFAAALLAMALPVSAAITATDDGSTGVPFTSTDEDTAIDTSGGLSVTTNDTTDVPPLSILVHDFHSALGAPVTVNSDGTFTYDPSVATGAQALAGGASVEDTFTYTIIESSSVTSGITLSLDATSGVDTFPWGAKPTAVPATGTSIPSAITEAFEYDGTAGSTRKDFSGGPDYSLTSASLEFWIRPDVVNANQTIFETGGNGTGSAICINDDGTVSWVVKNGTNPVAQSTTTLTAGTWYQIVATYERNNPSTTDTVKLYLNGALEDTATATNANDWSGTDDAGLARVNGTSAGDAVDIDFDGGNEFYGFFDGQIGTMLFYSAKVLTLTEVSDNFIAIGSTVVGTDTATVTIGLTGVNDAPDAANDTAGGFEDANVVSTADLTLNDGIVRTNAAGDDILALNYDARQSAGAGRWENLGSSYGDGGASDVDWLLGSGVTLNSGVTSSRAQITAAYEFDGTTNATGIYQVGALFSVHDIVNKNPDQVSATIEIWTKLGAADLTQISTLFETGGGTGAGIIVDNGVLEAATELDGGSQSGSTVSYDLVADSMSLLGAGPTSEFFQVAVVINDSAGLDLYVNGTLVDQSTGGVGGDWDGGDGSGLGHFGEDNHGGFQNGAATTAYDTHFNGSMASFRLYRDPLSGGQVRQNFEAVANDTDLDGETITVTGVLDASGNLVAISSPATLRIPFTYVDATTSNTTLDDGSPWTPVVGTPVAGDDEWTERVFGNGDTIYESNGDGSEDAPEIRTTISGLTPGTSYPVRAYFWGSSQWRGRASLTMGATKGYNTDHNAASGLDPMTAVTRNVTGGVNPTVAPVTDKTDNGMVPGSTGYLALSDPTGGSPYFTTAVEVEEDARALYAIDLGYATVRPPPAASSPSTTPPAASPSTRTAPTTISPPAKPPPRPSTTRSAMAPRPASAK